MQWSRLFTVAVVLPVVALVPSACDDDARPDAEPVPQMQEREPAPPRTLEEIAAQLDTLNRSMLRHVVRMRVRSPDEQRQHMA